MATLKQTTRKSLKKAARATKRTVARLSNKVQTALGQDAPKATRPSRTTRRRSVAI